MEIRGCVQSAPYSDRLLLSRFCTLTMQGPDLSENLAGASGALSHGPQFVHSIGQPPARTKAANCEAEA